MLQAAQKGKDAAAKKAVDYWKEQLSKNQAALKELEGTAPVQVAPKPAPAPTQPKDTLSDYRTKFKGELQSYGNEDYTPAARKHFESSSWTLNGDEVSAVRQYGGSGYRGIRAAQALEGGVSRAVIKESDSAIEHGRKLLRPLAAGQAKLTMNNPVGSNGRLYRGLKLKNEDLKKWLDSDVLDQSIEKTISTSVNQKVAWGYSDGPGPGRQRVVINYHAPKKAAPLLSPIASYSEEKEMLLEGRKFKIRKVTYDPGTTIWQFDVEEMV